MRLPGFDDRHRARGNRLGSRNAFWMVTPEPMIAARVSFHEFGKLALCASRVRRALVIRPFFLRRRFGTREKRHVGNSLAFHKLSEARPRMPGRYDESCLKKNGMLNSAH